MNLKYWASYDKTEQQAYFNGELSIASSRSIIGKSDYQVRLCLEFSFINPNPSRAELEFEKDHNYYREQIIFYGDPVSESFQEVRAILKTDE